jgi:hypothetical protein
MSAKLSRVESWMPPSLRSYPLVTKATRRTTRRDTAKAAAPSTPSPGTPPESAPTPVTSASASAKLPPAAARRPRAKTPRIRFEMSGYARNALLRVRCCREDREAPRSIAPHHTWLWSPRTNDGGRPGSLHRERLVLGVPLPPKSERRGYPLRRAQRRALWQLRVQRVQQVRHHRQPRPSDQLVALDA